VVVFYTSSALAANRAVLLNGSGPKNTRCQFISDIEMMKNGLGKNWDVTVLSGDGDDPANDSPSCKRSREDRQVLEPTDARGADGELLMQNTSQPDALPATVERYTGAIEKLASPAGSNPGDKILLYNTDHCSLSPDSKSANMTLLDGNITVNQNRELISKIPEDRTVILMPDCCFSEVQLLALFDEKDGALIPKRNRCGFSSSSADEYSYFGLQGYTRTFTNIHREKPALAFDALQRKAAIEGGLRHIPRATSNVFLSNYAKRALSACHPQDPILAPAAMEAISQTQRALLNRKKRNVEADLLEAFSSAGYPTTTSEEQIKKDYDALDKKLDKLFSEQQKAKLEEN
jgi:hypothetical protein